MTRIALVGCAHIHTPGFVKRLQARTDVQVLCVWDHEPKRAAASAEALKSRAVPDVEEIWADPRIDGVVICSETVRHEPLVLAAAAARKHVFVEKPLGMGAKDAFRMADALGKAGVRFQTGYFMRGDPIHLFLREQLAERRFGTVTRFRHTNCHAGSLKGWFDAEWRWMADPAQAGIGGFGDLGTHSLDILLWLMGDVEDVSASIKPVTGRYGDCDETGEALLNFDNGTLGSLAAGWVDVAHPVSLVLSGTKGHAHVAGGDLFFQAEAVPGADGKEPWRKLPEAWPHAFDLFLDALAGKDAALVSPGEAALRSAVMEAMYEASRRKAWVAPRRG
jgi:predicted dehydrogenase